MDALPKGWANAGMSPRCSVMRDALFWSGLVAGWGGDRCRVLIGIDIAGMPGPHGLV